HDVVLAQIRAVLDLDEHHRRPAGILDAMPGALRHGHRFPGLEAPGAARDDHARRTAHDHPVLGAPPASLAAEPLAGLDHQPLHLAAGALVEDGEAAPRPVLVLVVLARLARAISRASRRFAHGSMWMRRAKSAWTAFSTSVITSAGTSS